MVPSLFASGPARGAPGALLDESVYLNLTPLLDVLSNIMFFLLATFGASAVAVYSVSVPVQEAKLGATPLAGAGITVLLRLAPGEAHLSCSAAAAAPADLDGCQIDLAYPAQQPDVGALSRALQKIRAAHADAGVLVVMPAAGLSYASLVPLLDACRQLTEADGRRVPLFDDLVLAAPDTEAATP